VSCDRTPTLVVKFFALSAIVTVLVTNEIEVENLRYGFVLHF
jgi:hypothetical protein